MLDIQLTPHFSLSEFEYSAEACKRHINNIVPLEYVDSLYRLCHWVLEPVRAHFGAPVAITSGYRCEQLNEAIKGRPNSQHLVGEAADFVCHTKTPLYGIWEWMQTNVPYDQLIYESCPTTERVWIHVSLKSQGNRRQAFTEKVRVTKYRRRPKQESDDGEVEITN